MTDPKPNNYQQLLERIVIKISEERYLTEEALAQWLIKAEEFLEAAGELSQEEIELMAAYLKRDLQAFADSMDPDSNSDSPSIWLSSLVDTVWHALAEVTDKTQVEWRELAEDLAHDGVYRAQEWVGLGILKCTACGNQQEIYHATQLSPCSKCKGETFQRKPFKP